MTDLQESVAGTDPDDRASALQVVSVAAAGPTA